MGILASVEMMSRELYKGLLEPIWRVVVSDDGQAHEKSCLGDPERW